MPLSISATSAAATVTFLQQALFGSAAGNAVYSTGVSDVVSGGAYAYAISLGSNFSSSDSALSTTVLTNLGVTSTTIAAASYTAIQTAVTQAFAANPLARGAVVLNLCKILSNLEGDATYGTAATAFNTAIISNVSYSSSTTNTSARALDPAAAPAGQSFTLTTGFDNKTLSSGNDSFDGSLVSATQTLGSADVLNGGTGTDTLNAVLNTAVSITPTLTSIETLTIGTANAAATLNLVNSTGYTTLDANGATGAGALTFSNISSTTPALKLTSSGLGVTFAYTAAAVAGTADSATLTLSDVTAGPVIIAGVETVNIVSANSPNTIDASGIAATTLNASGTQNLALGTLSTSTTNLNAGTATGTLSATLGVVVNATVTGSAGADTLVVDGATGTVNVSTGLGDDRVTANAALLATDTINGGDGADTLVSVVASVNTTATATAFTNISNFETLEISGALAGTVTTAGVQAGLSAVTLALAGTGTINFEAGARTLNITTTALATGAVTVNDTGIATTDSLTIANTSTTALNVGGGQALTIGGMETVTINSTGKGAATTLTFGAIGLTPDTGGSATLNLVGGNSVQAAVITATSATSMTIDASGLTGTAAFTQTAASARATTLTGATNIIGSANADTLYAANTGTTVSGGAGKDTIFGGSAADNLSGGLADDTFTMAAVWTEADTISGGDGTDVITALTAATHVDSDFTNVTTVETVAIGRAVGTTALTLGALATAAGINKVTLGLNGAVETINVGAGFTGPLNVVTSTDTTALNDAEVVSAAAYTGALTITATQTLAAGSTFTGGTGTSDKINYDLTAGSITQAAIAGLTAIESITTSGSTANSLSVTLNDANIALTKTLTIDGSALTGGGALTVVGTAELDGALIVIGSSSADAITGTASTVVGDNLSGGAGVDTFTMAGNLTVLDTIAGGDGTDIMTISGTVLDAAFTNVSTVETLTATGATTLGAKALAAGITSVTETTTLTVGSGFTAALGVTFADATTSSVIATGYTGALTVTSFNAASPVIVAGTTVTGGSGTSDTLRINNTTAAQVLSAANLINVTAIENFTITGLTTNGVSFTLGDVNIAAAKSLTINGSNLTTGVLTVDGILESNGSLIVIGGSGADQITGTASTLGDNLSGGVGGDTFFMVTTNLTAADTIAGGDGTDIMSMSTTAPVLTDASFTSITSVETLTVTTGLAQTYTLGALAMASGLATISTFDATTALVDTVTVGAAFTKALTLNIGVGADNITGSASAAALTIATLAASVTAADTLIGGTSTGDVLKLTADNGTAATDLMAGIETITIVAATTATIGITMGANDLQIAAGKTLVVNGAALTNTAAALTFTGTASELDGSLSVTGGNGNDNLTGGGFTDTLLGGIGNDTITGGLSADVLTGGAGNDIFAYTSASVAASYGTTFDSITDWTSGADKLQVTLDYSALTSALTIDATRASAGVAGVSAAQDVLSGSRGQYVYDTTNSVLLINVNNDNLFTTSDFRIGLVAGSTASATVASDGSDINFNVSGGTIADVITTGGGADTISGGAGDDSLTGGAGADVISTTSGADTVIGGAGADAMTGGTGVDIFKWTATTAATFATEAATNAGATAAFTSGSIGDAVATFTTGTDKLHFAAAGVTNAAGTEIDTAIIIAAGGVVTNVARFVVVSTNQADLLFATAVTLLDGLDSTAVAIGDSFIAAIDNGVSSALYYVKQISTAGTIAAQDVTLIGQITGTAQLANGDFVSF